MQKVWMDTDIGNDIDDSVALAYLLKNPECDLLGISTVSGLPVERAKLADVICRAAEKDIPIFPGAEEPLLTLQRQPYPHQIEYLAGYAYGDDFKTGEALEGMYRAIKSSPGEVTLLAVGPMTNAALLIKAYPDAVLLLKEIVLMCGEFFGKSRYQRLENEWNAFCDPYATAMLYSEKRVPIRTIGLDVTSKITMNRDEVKVRYTSPILKTVYDFGGFESGKRNEVTYHDPLAAVCIFKPNLMEYRTGFVSVELRSERAMGRTYFDESADGNVRAAFSVDTDAFYDEYFSITG
jgi:inosine-uridine nucleoside N-ribohydrolase